MSNKTEIMQQLKNEILTLTLKPGTILSETVLSERFQISRTPLRDVLKQLALESYINVYPKKGNLVSYIDLESVEQMIFLRSTLEKEIIRALAVQMPLRGTLELTQILDKQKEAIQREHAHEAFLTWDDAFHKALFVLAGREFLWNLIGQYNVHYIRYRRLHLLKKEKLEEIRNEHQLMLDCITNHNQESIDALVQHHLHEDINARYLQENFADYIKK